jgi:hypothetical protein
MSWIARAGGQKVTIRIAQRGRRNAVPQVAEKICTIRKFFPQPLRPAAGSRGEEELFSVSKPPKSTPHSDIDGVRRDEKPNVQAAVEAGQGTETLALASDEAAAKPDHTDDVKNRDDRSQ